MPDPLTNLQTDDSLSFSTDISEVTSVNQGEQGIDPSAFFVDFVPRFNSFRDFHINDIGYYKSIAKTIDRLIQNVDPSESFAFSSVIYANFENVNPLTHREFLSPEYQNFLKNGASIRTYSKNDLIFEDRDLCMEDCKKVVMARRDFFFSVNGSTKGDLFLLNELQNRSLKTTWCQTPNFDLTSDLRCSDIDCLTTGPCLTKFGVLDLHNFSR